MRRQDIDNAKRIDDCSKQAKEKANTCLHPGCNKKAINSHIMQKNGILSSISEDNHLWESSIDHFTEELFVFNKKGINKIYTFLGFCNQHDTEIFRKIENRDGINLNDYESCLLLALRTACNEYRIKEVVINTQKCILNNPNNTFLIMGLNETIKQNKLGLKDISFRIDSMWKDLQNKTESFVFKYREIELIELCLNSIFTYETSQEIQDYFTKYQKNMERTSDIFISLFPYNGKSVLLIGYHKEDEVKVKSYVNLFFEEDDKSLKKRLSSLILFNCEVWVCSDRMFKEKFQGIEEYFSNAIHYSTQKGNEREVFDIDISSPNFKEEFKKLINNNFL